MSYDHVIRDLPIYKAAINDDWDSVSELFEQDPDLMTKQITYWHETPLHIAVSTGRSHRFVENLVKRIVATGGKEKLFVNNCNTSNPLHYASTVGNATAARLLVELVPEMTQVENWEGSRPLHVASFHENKETLRYLLTVTRDEEGKVSHYSGVAGGDLITRTIMNGFYAPSIKKIHDIKVNNHLSNLLVDRICKTVIEQVDHNIAWKILGSAMRTAAKYGIHELIEKCILTYPGIIWLRIAGGFYLFIAAIEQRQERVYNLIYQMSSSKVWTTVEQGEKNENALHIAAKLAPPQRRNVVTGAALQMQRELQWFQEVENLVQPSYKEALNVNGETPRMVFTESHKELLAEGREWMKDTASSCTVVAALIVTMAFAAAFTVPGGNQDNGNPLFLNYHVFMLFIVSDAVALFSSATSVLMFLGILTSRYAEADFLYALPKRLTIGLLSLFMSLAATMIAFSSALALVLKDKVTWIAAPLIIATSIPVCLFGLLQFPLLVELVKSTYGKSIFHQQNSQRIH
ncbi:hypothetical protein SSX86_008897 [Deinandra increscens subsp. villosa]|uniref:PGG domain-containing protein n=2 Tax=Deinandra increscens subsp. villosa TaxID=3103831 RepID=A0AAP0H2H0_9ASTR